MKLQKYFMCAVIALTAFGVSFGLTDVGRYLRAAFSAEAKKEEPAQTLTAEEIIYPPRVNETRVVQLVEQPAPVAESEENIEREFYADGDYYIVGDLPKGFKNFEFLSIATQNYENASEENDYRGIPIPPKGFLTAKKEFNFTRINIADKQIAFETEAKNGISYEFVGEFIEEEAIEIKDKEGTEYTDYAVLKGRLKKMRDGKKIAESQIKFAISHGC